MKWMDGQLIFRLLKSKSFTQKEQADLQYMFKIAWVLKVWYQTPPTSMLSLLNNTSLFAFVPLPLDCLQHKRHEISPQELSAGWQFSKGNPQLFQGNPCWWNILPIWPERCFFSMFYSYLAIWRAYFPFGETGSPGWKYCIPRAPMARRDGRLANQLRPPSMDLRPLLRADGSARFRFGDSTVGGSQPVGWLVGWKWCAFGGKR